MPKPDAEWVRRKLHIMVDDLFVDAQKMAEEMDGNATIKVSFRSKTDSRDGFTLVVGIEPLDEED